MTNERAIEILDPEHREHYESIEIVNEACRIGIEALEKRIPKKPVPNNELNCCPVCGDETIVLIWHKYCSKCGQALDWSDEEC